MTGQPSFWCMASASTGICGSGRSKRWRRVTGAVTYDLLGHGDSPAPPGTAYIALADIPWEKIEDPPTRTMLQRYAREAQDGGFAIYMGDETEGIVRPVD